PSARSDGGLAARSLIAGLDSRAFALAVYASSGGRPPADARLASGCWPGSTRWDWLPTGFQRKVSELFLLHLFPLSQSLPDARTTQLTCPGGKRAVNSNKTECRRGQVQRMVRRSLSQFDFQCRCYPDVSSLSHHRPSPARWRC